MKRRCTDQPTELDQLRFAGWFWLGYLTLCAVCLFLLTPSGHALLHAIWSQP